MRRVRRLRASSACTARRAQGPRPGAGTELAHVALRRRWSGGGNRRRAQGRRGRDGRPRHRRRRLRRRASGDVAQQEARHCCVGTVRRRGHTFAQRRARDSEGSRCSVDEVRIRRDELYVEDWPAAVPATAWRIGGGALAAGGVRVRQCAGRAASVAARHVKVAHAPAGGHFRTASPHRRVKAKPKPKPKPKPKHQLPGPFDTTPPGHSNGN